MHTNVYLEMWISSVPSEFSSLAYPYSTHPAKPSDHLYNSEHLYHWEEHQIHVLLNSLASFFSQEGGLETNNIIKIYYKINMFVE